MAHLRKRISTQRKACGSLENWNPFGGRVFVAKILPFRALCYNREKVSDLNRVVTQPYDKISPQMQARYYDLSPYNLVRVICGRQAATDSPADNVYTRAARHFQEWIEQRVLLSDPEPSLYSYSQEYSLPGQPSVIHKRRGFIALCRLEDYSAGVVHRHEETLSGPKADRLELLKATRAHFGQIFMLYSDPAEEIEKALQPGAPGQPTMVVTDEYGSRHSLWRETDPATIERVVEAMRDRQLVIADGHHRYETALAYRDYCRAQGRTDGRADYGMMTFIRKESEGLTILPTHRVVHSLAGFDWNGFASRAARFFTWKEIKTASGGAVTQLLATLAESGREAPSLVAFAGSGRAALLRPRQDLDFDTALPELPAGLRHLDVVILHRLLFEQVLGIDRQAVREEKNLRYVREAADGLLQVESGQAQVAFLMNPTPVEDVWANALAGNPLPQKSTDFYPKLLSGLTVYWLDNPAGM
jgi:uncharacterized protein (DUF1015 family)